MHVNLASFPEYHCVSGAVLALLGGCSGEKASAPSRASSCTDGDHWAEGGQSGKAGKLFQRRWAKAGLEEFHRDGVEGIHPEGHLKPRPRVRKRWEGFGE